MRAGNIGIFCIENPIKEFNGVKLPDYKACLDFDALAQSQWVSLFRIVLLFMLLIQFFSACAVVLRQF